MAWVFNKTKQSSQNNFIPVNLTTSPPTTLFPSWVLTAWELYMLQWKENTWTFLNSLFFLRHKCNLKHKVMEWKSTSLLSLFPYKCFSVYSGYVYNCDGAAQSISIKKQWFTYHSESNTKVKLLSRKSVKLNPSRLPSSGTANVFENVLNVLSQIYVLYIAVLLIIPILSFTHFPRRSVKNEKLTYSGFQI